MPTRSRAHYRIDSPPAPAAPPPPPPPAPEPATTPAARVPPKKAAVKAKPKTSKKAAVKVKPKPSKSKAEATQDKARSKKAKGKSTKRSRAKRQAQADASNKPTDEEEHDPAGGDAPPVAGPSTLPGPSHSHLCLPPLIDAPSVGNEPPAPTVLSPPPRSPSDVGVEIQSSTPSPLPRSRAPSPDRLTIPGPSRPRTASPHPSLSTVTHGPLPDRTSPGPTPRLSRRSVAPSREPTPVNGERDFPQTSRGIDRPHAPPPLPLSVETSTNASAGPSSALQVPTNPVARPSQPASATASTTPQTSTTPVVRTPGTPRQVGDRLGWDELLVSPATTREQTLTPFSQLFLEPEPVRDGEAVDTAEPTGTGHDDPHVNGAEAEDDPEVSPKCDREVSPESDAEVPHEEDHPEDNGQLPGLDLSISTASLTEDLPREHDTHPRQSFFGEDRYRASPAPQHHDEEPQAGPSEPVGTYTLRPVDPDSGWPPPSLDDPTFYPSSGSSLDSLHPASPQPATAVVQERDTSHGSHAFTTYRDAGLMIPLVPSAAFRYGPTAQPRLGGSSWSIDSSDDSSSDESSQDSSDSSHSPVPLPAVLHPSAAVAQRSHTNTPAAPGASTPLPAPIPRHLTVPRGASSYPDTPELSDGRAITPYSESDAPVTPAVPVSTLLPGTTLPSRKRSREDDEGEAKEEEEEGAEKKSGPPSKKRRRSPSRQASN